MDDNQARNEHEEWMTIRLEMNTRKGQHSHRK